MLGDASWPLPNRHAASGSAALSRFLSIKFEPVDRVPGLGGEDLRQAQSAVSWFERQTSSACSGESSSPTAAWIRFLGLRRVAGVRRALRGHSHTGTRPFGGYGGGEASALSSCSLPPPARAGTLPAVRRALCLVILVACGKSTPAAPDAAPEPAAVEAADASGETAKDGAAPRIQTPPPPVAPRARLTLTLRSSPPGAAAAVDGRPVGQTPVLHQVDADGKPHEFTFVLPGYAPWRVRFPPVKDGVIHATLTPVRFGDAAP
jgi:hypothetical protein